MPHSKYIVVTGGIGTGKTTLVKLLAEMCPGAIAIEEWRGRFLEDFYRNPKAFAFKNQLDYSLQFVERAPDTLTTGRVIFQERCILDVHEVFSASLHEAGYIDEQEFSVLTRVYSMGAGLKPKLLVFLETANDVAYARVHARGVPQEREVSLVYLRAIAERYERWYEEKCDLCPRLRIRTDTMPAREAAQVVAHAVARELS